jgi:hypothetical protein
MEVIRGSDLNLSKMELGNVASPLLSEEKALNLQVQDITIQLNALSALLIEKGLITREELVSMVYQKKMGL